jgi:predicted ribosome quality control (RQC) complex YloA/Tae2 family protein
MSLRKYLPGSWITDVEQHEFERVVSFQFKAKEVAMKLFLELFGEGNIILTGQTGEILQALFFKRMRDRNIVRNEVYLLPPSSSKNPFKVTKEEFEIGLKAVGDTDVVRAVIRFLGVGGVYGEELLLRSGVNKTKLCNELTDAEIDLVFDGLKGLLSPFSSQRLDPNIVLDPTGGFLDVAPIRLKRYEDFKLQFFECFSDALDEYFVRVTAAEKAIAGVDVSQIRREAERLKRMIAEQEHALSEEERKTGRDKQIGDSIYAHFNELQCLLEKFSTVWEKGGELMTAASDVAEAKKTGQVPAIFFESFDGRNLAINIHLGDLSFSLSLKKSLYENAAEFYDRGKQAKQKMSAVTAALEDSHKKLAGIEKQLSKVEALKTAAPAEAMDELATRKVETKEWFEKFRWFKSSEGFLVVAGKDVVSNEVLIKKYTEPYDVVFHADIVGSPFAVVKTEGKEPGEQTLREAGEFAAAYCRAWRENMGSIDVYWVKPEQLSKSGSSGEFVPHGAFAVSGKRNWMRGVPLRLAVGVEVAEEEKFTGGPVNAVKENAKVYVVLVPGEVTGKDLLKEIQRSLTLKMPKDQREKLSKASIEKIREFVPYTKARIMLNQ